MDQKTWLWRKRSSEKTIVANGDEVQPVQNDKQVELENSLKTLNEKLVSVLDECSAKDKLAQDYEIKAEAAVAEKQKAEEEFIHLKQELEEATKQREAANERLVHLNSALKDCMEQLNTVREEQEQKVQEAITNTSKEFEKAHKTLEEKVASLTAESSYLSKALLVKEKLMDDLTTIKIQTESEFEALMTRLDSVEKENAFLRYEFRTLEKELDLRNDEMEYGRRSLEASHKQHLEDVKKIKKLESECQRLRALMRKRLSGPAATLGNVKNDRKGIIGNSVPHNTSKNNTSFLIDQVHGLERENQILRESLAKKEEEIIYYEKSKNVSFQDKFALALSNNPLPPDEHSIVDSNAVTSSHSWEPPTEPECKMIGASEMSLMDDFVEMEKLAIVAVDPLGPSDESCNKSIDWIKDVRTLILEQHRIRNRSVDELLEDIRMDLRNNVIQSEPSNVLPISGYITWKSPTSSPSSSMINESQPSDLNRSIGKIIELVGRFNHHPCEESLKDRIHVFRWENSELATMLEEFVCNCNDLLGGKINFEKFIGDLATLLGWLMNNCVCCEDHCNVRDEFRKYLGGDGPGTALELESVQNLMLEMEKMHSGFQVEIKGLKNELDSIGLLEKDYDLKNELESLKELKTTNEDQIENLKAMNEDLDTQLSVTKAKLNEVQQKLSSAEVELENKNHSCEELEGTCLELQLQLESIASKQNPGGSENQEALLQTGMEITKASVRLAECEKTIFNLGKQLKSLGPSKELSVVDKVLSITDTKMKKLRQRSSLRDQMMSEDTTELKHLKSSKEITSTTASPNKKENKDANARALVIVPSKKKGGGFALLKKLLLRRRKTSSINNSIYFGK